MELFVNDIGNVLVIVVYLETWDKNKSLSIFTTPFGQDDILSRADQNISQL